MSHALKVFNSMFSQFEDSEFNAVPKPLINEFDDRSKASTRHSTHNLSAPRSSPRQNIHANSNFFNESIENTDNKNVITNSLLSLNKQEAEKIRVAFEDKVYDPTGSDAYISDMRKTAYGALPNRILDILNKLRSTDSGEPFIVIDGLPIDGNIIGSPNKGELGQKFKDGSLTENLLVGIAAIIGEPYSIKHEGSEIVNNLVPSKAAASEYTGLGYDVELDFHIENAMQARSAGGDTSPTELVLFGIRGQPDGADPKTRVADCREALKLLPPHHIETLRQPVFELKAPYRWRQKSDVTKQDNSAVVSPIITGPDHAPRVTVAFYPDMAAGLSEDAAQALTALREALEKVAVGITVRPGRLVVINNRFCLHAREKFDATFDAQGRAHRWLQRVFVSPQLWNFREFNRHHDRVFAPIKNTKL